MNGFFEWFDGLRNLTLAQAALWCLVENVFLFVLTLLVGHWLIALYREKRVAETPEPISGIELFLAGTCVLLNTLVTIAGFVLWRADIIRIRYEVSLFGVILDVLVLFFAMDFAMYVLHRVAHHPFLYPLVHRTHHRFENPRPLTLFVLNPAETLSFGILWLILITVYSSSLFGIAIYLAFNLIFGLVGHLGVEPLPMRWLKLPVLNNISTSTFHAEHHGDKDHNYGFYTLIWDRLFGTLSPEYIEDFTRANGELKAERLK